MRVVNIRRRRISGSQERLGVPVGSSMYPSLDSLCTPYLSCDVP